MLHLKISSQRRVPLESLLSSSAMVLMRRRIRVQGGAAFELNIVLQNELNMARWDGRSLLQNYKGALSHSVAKLFLVGVQLLIVC